MDVARDHFLARAGFALDQHGGGERERTADDVEHPLHGRALADDVAQRHGIRDEFAQLLVLAAEGAVFDSPVHDHEQLVLVERLGEVVGGAFLHGGDGGLDSRVGRHHDDLDFGPDAAGAAEQFEAVHLGHAQVGQQQVEGLRLERGEGILARRTGAHFIAAGLENIDEDVALNRVVFRDEDSGTHVAFPCRGSLSGCTGLL